MRRIRVTCLIVSIACLCASALAQQSGGVEPAQLALEIYFYPKEPPAYQPVTSSLRGNWFTRFHRIKSEGPNDLPVNAVDVKSILTQDGIRVSVSVLFGELHQKRQEVASYTIHEGERVKVASLSQFGIDPFTIAVVAFSPSALELPEFVSKAKSIDFLGIQPGAATTPTFRVTVRNLSGKNVRALYMRVTKGGDSQSVFMPQGKEGEPLIAIGNPYELTARITVRAVPTANGIAQVTLPGQVIEVSTAIFDDGSFEGDGEPALNYAASRRGNKIALIRVVELFQRALEDQSAPAARAESLKQNLAALSLEADPAWAQEVISEFSQPVKKTPEELKNNIQVGMRMITNQALEIVKQFQLRNPQPSANSLNSFLTISKQRYEAWLTRA